jgi:DNA-binding MarR family transcriptional regulator
MIRQALLWVFQNFDETLAPIDIRPVQYSILTAIKEKPGVSQMALSQMLGIVRSGVVPLPNELESRSSGSERPTRRTGAPARCT